MKNRQNNNFSPMSSEGLLHLFKGWRKATIRYSPMFAAVPAVIAGNSQDVRAEEGTDDSQTASRERGNLPRRQTVKPKFLGSGQNLANSRSATLSNLITGGSDSCPGTPIPAGTYTAASPYVDTDSTTGANNTVNLLYYYWYEYAADGPDRIYSFKLNSLGADPKITVTTTSPTYRPMIYVLGGCPDGLNNTVSGWWAVNDSRWGSGNTAEVAPSWLQLGGQYYVFVDSSVANDGGAYTLTLKDMQIASTTPPPTPTPTPTPEPTPTVRTNYALASNGGVATASSTYSNAYPASGSNDGDRKGQDWANGGGWNDASPNAYPDVLEIAFDGTKTIDEIGVFTVQDNYITPVEPDESDTFTAYGITSFDVQYWNGSGWVTVPNGSITNNNKVWTKLTFTPVATSKVRVVVNASLLSYSRIVELEAWSGGSSPTPTPTPDPTPPERTNFALASNGGVASGSSEYSDGFPVAGTNNGDRKGLNWGDGGGWNDNNAGLYPDFLQVDFNGTKTIDEIDVFTVQDNYSEPSEPDLNMTFSQYGITHFDIQYWNGSDWLSVPGGGITGNNKVWTHVTFPAVTTNKIRVKVNNSLASYSRIVEVEAWGGESAPPPPPRTNFALASNGGVASASSEYSSGYPVSGTNNGDRKGLNWAAGGGWNDNSAGVYPDFLQIDFNGIKTIDEIDVFTIQDNYLDPAEPDLNTTFSLYGITHFDVQYWNGSAWVTIPGGSITNNEKVWTKIGFSELVTSKVRVLINGSLAGYSRIVEVEAWGEDP